MVASPLAVVDLGVSQIPHIVFVFVHLAILVVAIGLLVKTARDNGPAAFRWAFGLIAAGEISYIGYHTEVTTFLLSHTLSEVFVLVAIILFFRGWASGATR